MTAASQIKKDAHFDAVTLMRLGKELAASGLLISQFNQLGETGKQ